MNETQRAEYLNNVVTTQWEVITPESAEEMLKHNTNNYRAISNTIVSRYVDEIQSNSWEANGDTIVFNSEGTLLNGQHRLMAVVNAKKPIVSLVVRGLPDSQIFDIGRKRNTRVILLSEGYGHANTTTISAVSVLIKGFDHRKVATLSEIRDVLAAEKELLIQSYELTQGSARAITRKASVMAATFCALKIGLSEPSKIQQVFRIANTGFPIEGLNSLPGLALRMSLQAKSDGKWEAEAREFAFDATIQAILDYENGVERKTGYRSTKKGEAVYNVVHQMIVRDILEASVAKKEIA